MPAFSSINDILNFAIGEEEAAVKFYTTLAENMERQNMKKVFQDFALEEVGHKSKLLAIKEGKLLVPSERKAIDLKVGDYLVEVEPTKNMDYQDALIIAMKKEKAAFKLYNDLATTTNNADLKSIFLMLAQEEAKHKVRFEIEYDDLVNQEN